MKIEMPGAGKKVSSFDEVLICTPYLVREKESRELKTVIITNTENGSRVVFFGERSGITHSDFEWLKRQYEYVREYSEGESFKVTA